MENNMNSVQLEEIVKNNLANYEARYDANDWSRMEGLLGAAPDSSSFNWKPVLIVFIVCIFLGGAYALYTYLDFSGNDAKKSSTYTPPVVKKPAPSPAKKIVPVIAAPPVDTVVKDEHQDEPAVNQTPEEIPVTKSESKPEKEKINSEDSEKEIQRKKEESEARRARRKALAAAKDSAKEADSSSKEVTRKTEKKEKEKAKSSSVGFNIFSTINADSLKKYQERLKKDSVK